MSTRSNPSRSRLNRTAGRRALLLCLAMATIGVSACRSSRTWEEIDPEAEYDTEDPQALLESLPQEPPAMPVAAETDVATAVETNAVDTEASRPSAPETTGFEIASRMPLLRPGVSVTVVVEVNRIEELRAPNRRILDSGRIALPMVGEVAVAGLTIEEAAQTLADAFAPFYVQRPRVSVEFVLGADAADVAPWGSVTVLGRVSSPGRIAIPPTRDLTVSSAIQRAGGFASSARDTSVRVSRQTGDGSVMRKTVNLRAVGTEGRSTDDLLLQDGDIVFVPEVIF